MKYKFEEFKVEIENPTVVVKNVIDNIIDKKCSVEILLTTDSCKFGLTLTGFEYTDVWYDEDITNWVNNKLKEYKL